MSRMMGRVSKEQVGKRDRMRSRSGKLDGRAVRVRRAFREGRDLMLSRKGLRDEGLWYPFSRRGWRL